MKWKLSEKSDIVFKFVCPALMVPRHGCRQFLLMFTPNRAYQPSISPSMTSHDLTISYQSCQIYHWEITQMIEISNMFLQESDVMHNYWLYISWIHHV